MDFSNLFVFLAVALAPTTHGQSAVANVTHEVFLDVPKNFLVRWSFNATHIDLEMMAKTLGWLAVGISPNGGMDQSDVLMGWLDDRTRRPVVQDRWIDAPSYDNVNLLMDAQQDWILVSGSQNDTHTSIRAVRKLVTCDYQDRPFTSDTLRLIFATNPSDPRTPTSIVKHTYRGTRSMLMLSDVFRANASAEVNSDPSLQELDIVVNQVVVNATTRTMYHCSLVKLPPVDQKYHIVAITPLVTPGNEGVVHHVLAYTCSNMIDDSFPSKDFDCTYIDGQPNPMRDMVTGNCTTILAVFGIGSDTYYFPPEAGLPLTPEMGEKYVFLEMHYDNPDAVSIVDSSGITLMVTTTLRPNDAAIMFTGSSDMGFRMVIPPHLDDFTVYGHCPRNCTSANLPRTGINVINVFLHTHLLGRKVYLRQIRNRRELPPLAKDDNYDFNYQESQRVSPSRVVLPGDELIVECHYSSTSRSAVTFGGWGTPQEMCMAFVTYYPATQMTMCTSQAKTETLLRATNYISPRATFREDQPFDEIAYKAYLTSRFQWNTASVAMLENIYTNADYNAYCLMDLPNFFYNTLSVINYTTYTPVDACHNAGANLNTAARPGLVQLAGGSSTYRSSMDSHGNVQNQQASGYGRPGLVQLAGGPATYMSPMDSHGNIQNQQASGYGRPGLVQLAGRPATYMSSMDSHGNVQNQQVSGYGSSSDGAYQSADPSFTSQDQHDTANSVYPGAFSDSNPNMQQGYGGASSGGGSYFSANSYGQSGSGASGYSSGGSQTGYNSGSSQTGLTSYNPGGSQTGMTSYNLLGGSQTGMTSYNLLDGSQTSSASSSSVVGSPGSDPISTMFDLLKSKWLAFIATLGGFVQSMQFTGATS